jgi:hypothetical protein
VAVVTKVETQIVRGACSLVSPPTSFKFMLGFNRIQAYDQKDMSHSFFS